MSKLQSNTGFVHAPVNGKKNIWKGNFNPDEQEVEQKRAPIVLIDMKTLVFATFHRADESFISKDQLVLENDDIPLENGILNIEKVPEEGYYRPVFRSLKGEYAFFLKRNKNGTVYFYMVAEQKEDFNEAVEARMNEVNASFA